MSTKEELEGDIRFLLFFLPDWCLYPPEEGYDPTMYGTGKYENDKLVYDKVTKIKDKVMKSCSKSKDAALLRDVFWQEIKGL
jgi:hypothetical protein